MSFLLLLDDAAGGPVVHQTTGAIAGTGTLAGTPGATATTVTGSISGTGTLAGAPLAVAVVTGSMSGAGILAGTPGSTATTVTGSMSGTGTLAGSAVRAAVPGVGSIGRPDIVYLGEIGSWNSSTPSSFPIVAPTTHDVPVGDTLVIMGSFSNYLSGGVADTGILVFVGAEDPIVLTPAIIADPGIANEGVQGFIATVTLEVEPFLTASGVAVAFATSTLSSWSIHHFTKVNRSTPVLSGSYAVQNNQTGQSVSVATGVALTAAGQLAMAMVAVEGDTGDVFTEDTDTLGGPWVSLARRSAGTGTGGVTLNQAYKITTATGTQTYGGTTMLGTARDHAAAVVAFDQAPNATLSGEAAKVAATTGAVSGSGALSGLSVALRYTSGTSAGTGSLAGATVKEAAAAGALAGAGTLTGTPVAIAIVTGALGGTGTLNGELGISGTISGSGALAGNAVAIAVVTGSLLGTGAFTGIVPTGGLVTGTGLLSGSAIAIASITGLLSGGGSLAGDSTGVALLTGSISSFGTVAGTADRRAVTAGQALGSGFLTADAIRQAVAAGAFAGIGTLGGDSGLVIRATTGLLLGTGLLTGAIPSGAPVAKYWNGSAWVPVPGTIKVYCEGEWEEYPVKVLVGSQWETVT